MSHVLRPNAMIHMYVKKEKITRTMAETNEISDSLIELT